MVRNLQQSAVNTSALQRLYRSSPEAKAMLDSFARRERDRKDVTVDRLRSRLDVEGMAVTAKRLRELLEQLEKLGCGRLVIGRRGHPTRFEWSVAMNSVGKAAAGDPVTIETLPPILEEDGPDTVLEPQFGANSTLEHRFQLRPDFAVTLTLPISLTTTEAGRLSNFVKSLPFKTDSPPTGADQ